MYIWAKFMAPLEIDPSELCMNVASNDKIYRCRSIVTKLETFRKNIEN